MPNEILDPQTFDLGIVFTAAGIPIAGGIIAAFIQVLKRVPFVGSWLVGEQHARLANVVLSAGLVGYAAFAISVTITPVSAFMLFLGWVNLAGFTDAAYKAAPETVRTTLGGQG